MDRPIGVNFRWRYAAAAICAVAVLAPLAPRQFGGPVAYVTTAGDSMEPRIHTGDLVIARKMPDYVVGDVIAYPSRTLGITLLHRIVNETQEGFVTRGDNRTQVDPDRPNADVIYGKEWIHIHQGGIWLRRLASPAVVGGIAFFILWWSTTVSAVHRPRRRRRQTMGVAPHKPRAVR